LANDSTTHPLGDPSVKDVKTLHRTKEFESLILEGGTWKFHCYIGGGSHEQELAELKHSLLVHSLGTSITSWCRHVDILNTFLPVIEIHSVELSGVSNVSSLDTIINKQKLTQVISDSLLCLLSLWAVGDCVVRHSRLKSCFVFIF
jgi:hypothetical protein